MKKTHIAVAITCLVSCGPDRQREEAREFAEALCAATMECGCAPRFESAEACENEFATRFDEIIDAGLDVDSSCFDLVLGSFEADPCSPRPLNGDEACDALVGTKTEGAACKIHHEISPLLANECGKDLWCYEGTCSAMPGELQPKTAGDPCNTDFPTSCHGVDLYCGADSICHERTTLSAPCEPFGCMAPLVCVGAGDDGSGVCAEQASLGESCDPLDWDPCVGSEEPDETVVCDAVDSVCTLGQPLCPRLSDPRIWY